MLVDRAPQVMDFAVDPDEDLVEVPFVAGAGAPTTQQTGVGLPELGTPAPVVSQLTTTPRASISSSTSRKLSENRKYSHTQ